MPTAIITGSGGLIGSESVQHFVEAGRDVFGLERDYPDWTLDYDVEAMLRERYERDVELWRAVV